MNPAVHTNVYTLQDRLNLIAQRIDASMRAPQKTKAGRQYMLRDLAVEIVRGTPQHGLAAEDAQIAAIFRWVVANVEYRLDPRDYDLYMAAGRTINSGGADCDDHTALNAALCSSLGYQTGAKIVSPDGQAWHIYAVVGVHPISAPREIYTMDTTQPGSYPGWEPGPEHRRHEWQCMFSFGRATALRRLR